MSYYVHGGKRVPIKPSSSFLALHYQPGPAVPKAVSKLARHKGFTGKRNIHELPNDGLMLLQLAPGIPASMLMESIAAPSLLSSSSPFTGIPEVFETEDGSLLIPDGRVNARLPPGTDQERSALLEKVGAGLLSATPGEFHVLEPKDGDVFRLANTLAEQEGVKAQPCFTKLLRQRRPVSVPSMRTLTTTFMESALLLPRQWGLYAIEADKAWSVTRGSPEVRVALIDTGVDLEHVDLKPNLLEGYDDYDDDNQPEPGPSWYGENAHGTACAGIIAAAGRNGIGISGVAPECTLIPIRLGTSQKGLLYTRDSQAEVRCIRKAVELGAWVISISYDSVADEAVQEALQEAIEHGRGGNGCVVVAAAGNDAGNVKYPAAYPDVIAVAGTRQDDDRCTSSQWGEGNGSCFGSQVCVSAPGFGIWTTDIRGTSGYRPSPPTALGGNDYTDNFGGTSAACPFVAGVAALILSANPRLKGREVREILEMTADKTGGEPYDSRGHNVYLGWGRVNAFKAVQEAHRRR